MDTSKFELSAENRNQNTPASARVAPADTPIMKQYLAAKARYPRHLLFFRIGDFFELFFEDAVTASRALGLTLTSRHKGADAVQMAGVPAHAVEQYLARLLRQGFSVAICDQTEDALQAKGLIKRDVTRVVTPGTVLEESLLEAKKPNRLLAILPNPSVGASIETETNSRRYGLASVDLASGCIFVQELEGVVALRSELARLSPSEYLLPEDSSLPREQKPPSLLALGIADTAAVAWLKVEAFGAREAYERLISRFGQNGRDRQAAANFKKLIQNLPLAACAVGALLGYIDETYAGGKVLLSPPQSFDPDKFLALSDAAIRSLELLETLRARGFEGSLLWVIDRACTGPGSRCLREWLIRPLREIEPLKLRHDAVGALVENVDLRVDLRELLKNLADIERIAARLSASRATPRDLVALKNSLLLLPKLRECLNCVCSNAEMLPATGAIDASDATTLIESLLASICRQLMGLDFIAELIARQLKDDCSNTLNEGGLMQPSVDVELDRLRAIASGGKEWIAAFQTAEAARSGIASLKIGYNRVFGYYIEISRANQHLAPKDYERRQTLTNAERYTTPALKEREAEVLGAEEKICALEQQLFLKLREQVAQSAELLQAAGQALAELDALCSLAEVAHKKGHTRPLINNSGRLRFEQMRHPVLEDTLPKGDLVPNDLFLATRVNRQTNGQIESDDNAPQILLLTGPNMAGKSTYIRAGALCVILAQMGAFVPAEKAEIGLVDRIFTRVGAADDVAGGRSTFMVEMIEVAEILAASSTDSLLILDEVGRGTSTYDGVSLAWALTEYLHNGPVKPRALFATHYHELCALEEELPRVKNASASVKEWQGEIAFLHRIVAGPSERSFGIHVARLAGLPASVLSRAKDILDELENEAVHRVSDLTNGAQIGNDEKQSARSANFEKKKRLKPSATDGQLLLFEPNPDALDPSIKELLETLRALDLSEMTPMEALNTLDKLTRKAKGL